MRKLKIKTRNKKGKRKTRRVQKGGSIFPDIAHHAFWGVADSLRDSYNSIAGNYPGVSSSIMVQGTVSKPI